MVVTRQSFDTASAREIDDIVNAAPDAHAAITAWLNVFVRLLHLPEAQRSAIRNELYEHLRERTRDLMLANRNETESVRLAIEELGETVQLARRFEAANRPHTRRWLMYASMLGFGAAVLVTGTIVLTPNQQPQSLATVFAEQPTNSTEIQRSLSEKDVDISNDMPLLSVARNITEAVGRELVMSPAEFQEHGIDVNDHFLQIQLHRVPVTVALDRIAAELSRQSIPIGWRADDRIIEIAPKEVLDARDLTLVSYNIGDIIRSVTSYGRPYENAVADVTSLLHEIVEPESWRENGGALAQLRVVGGRMFVQAPKRMHTQIEWILEQLRQDIGNEQGADARPPAPQMRTTLHSGDKITISIFELYQANEWAKFQRTVDGDGLIKIPEVGEIGVVGMKRRDLEQSIVNELSSKIMKDPKVDVEIEFTGPLRAAEIVR